jgi:hypothetical protein
MGGAVLRYCRTTLVLAVGPLLCAAAPPLAFSTPGERFAAAADDYRQLWQVEGPQIIAAIESVTGLSFPAEPIEVIVRDGPPMTSFDGRTIRLRAGSSPNYRRATFIHELGHRLALTLPRTEGLDDHRLLYLFLYDVWADLYGQAFADRMVAIERRIPGGYDYDAAWTWALSMTREARQARLRGLRTRLAYDPAALRP